MPFDSKSQVRKDRLAELLKYAHEVYRPGLPLKFLKPPLRGYAMMKWGVSRVTAWDYADTVLTVLEFEFQKQRKEVASLAQNR